MATWDSVSFTWTANRRLTWCLSTESIVTPSWKKAGLSALKLLNVRSKFGPIYYFLERCFICSDVFEFDNSYSWVRSKTVSYTIELEPQMNEPANEIEERFAEIPLEDPTENLPESSTENPPEDYTENLPDDSTDNLPEGSTENPPEDCTENPPEDSTENPPEDSTENLPEGSIENPPEDPNENPPEDSTKNTTKDSTKNAIESPISE